jgi:hypothetical protein
MLATIRQHRGPVGIIPAAGFFSGQSKPRGFCVMFRA